MKIELVHLSAAALFAAAFTPSTMVIYAAETGRPPAGSTTKRGNIVAEVHERLAARLPDNIDTIRVKARNGEVILSGNVDMLPKRHIAHDAAKSVPGIVQVKNHLTVTPEQRSDNQIGTAVKMALSSDPATAKQQINVTVEEAVVILRGRVETIWQKRFTAWIASNQRGVREVRNEIRVTPATRADAEIRAELAQLYAHSPLFSDNAITVHVRDGAVVLTGTVDSLRTREQAERDAWIGGVLQVDASALKVNQAANFTRAPSRTPADIVRDVNTAIKSNAALANNDLNPKVENGQLILSGEVDSFYEKWVAEDLVGYIRGVSDVHNRLRIKGADFVDRAEHYHQPPGWHQTPTLISPGQTVQEADAKLKAAVERALAADPRLFGEKLEVSVQRGVVTLRGPLETLLVQAAAVHDAYEAGAWLVEQEFGVGVPP